ncbi:MAG: Dabb family protein [Ruminococcaceae bacterium]|nr:Dabb family protein [Oscillospiraceae bacterium]
MICHVVMWKLKENNPELALNMKKELEALKGKIPGLESIQVGIDKNPENVVLISTHSSWEALDEYAKHPLHVSVADTYVRPFTASRQAVNYEM